MTQQSWQRTKLGDYFRIKHGFAFKGKFFSDSGPYVLLTPGNFREEGGLKLKGEKEKYYTDSFPPEYLLRRGDLLIAMTDLKQSAPILGSPAFVQESERFLHNQRLGKIIELDEEQMDKCFLYYLLNAQETREQIKATATGATVKHTAPDRIYSVRVEVPPLSTQRKIASVLSAYDDLIENNTRRIKILEEMAQAIYREWFVNFRFPGHEKVRMVESELGLIPEEWEAGRLDDALLLQRGFDLPIKARKNGTVPVYAATGVVGFHNESKVKGPGVITGRSGSLGTVLFVTEDYWPLNTTLWIKEFRQVTPLYAFYLLKGLDLESFNSGAAVPTLNRNDVHGLPVVLPTRKVLEHFENHIIPLYRLKKNLEQKNTNLRYTRDLLLPKLISGEISVEDLDINLEDASEPNLVP